MIISLSVLPMVLLFVCSVNSVDNYKRKYDIDSRTYNLNHPPLGDDYDTIPVAVLNNDDELKAEVNNTKSDLDKSDKTEGGLEVMTIDSDKIITKESLKPKARSFRLGSQITTAKANDTVLQKSIDHKNNNRRITQRKTLKQVRRTKVNKNETEVKTNERLTKIVAAQKDNRHTTQKPITQTSSQRPQSTTVKSVRRTRTRAPVVPIIESENYVYSHRGNFHYSYEGGDGTRAFERGELKKSENGSGMGEAVVGSFSYTDEDGNDFSLSYTADENGYRPVGAHLPTPPPIPPEIQAALRLLATKTTPEPVTERVKKI